MNWYPIFFKLNENVYYIIEKKFNFSPFEFPFQIKQQHNNQFLLLR